MYGCWCIARAQARTRKSFTLNDARDANWSLMLLRRPSAHPSARPPSPVVRDRGLALHERLAIVDRMFESATESGSASERRRPASPNPAPLPAESSLIFAASRATASLGRRGHRVRGRGLDVLRTIRPPGPLPWIARGRRPSPPRSSWRAARRTRGPSRRAADSEAPSRSNAGHWPPVIGAAAGAGRGDTPSMEPSEVRSPSRAPNALPAAAGAAMVFRRAGRWADCGLAPAAHRPSRRPHRLRRGRGSPFPRGLVDPRPPRARSHGAIIKRLQLHRRLVRL